MAKKQLRKVRADFHNHLRTSSRLKDSDFNTAIDIASERLWLGGTFGMINFADKRYEKFIGLKGYERVYIGENKNAIYIPEKDILVIKGQEVPTRQGHLLVLGLSYDEHITQYQTLEDTLNEAKDKNRTIIADHPFSFEGIGNYLKQDDKNYRLLRKIDAIEIYNGEASIRPLANWRAQNLFNTIVTYPTGAISTSDGHSFYELGTNWTEIDEIDRKKFSESLRKSVQNTKESVKMKSGNWIGDLDHITDLIFIVKIAPKLRLDWMFETERPEFYLPPFKMPEEK